MSQTNTVLKYLVWQERKGKEKQEAFCCDQGRDENKQRKKRSRILGFQSYIKQEKERGKQEKGEENSHDSLSLSRMGEKGRRKEREK
uniref:Uncharacterized protein n=1 Tax=Rhizophora mucronata TaxID=61149 RepID=A0A2P2KWI4_RHIMU